MSASQTRLSVIDHLGVVGRDAAAMVAAYKRLGFAPTEPVPLMGEDDGTPVPLGQDSAHLIFADSYVELSGVTTSDPGHHLAAHLAKRAGLHILAFGTADAAGDNQALTKAGHTVMPVQNAGRHVDYGTRHGDAQFRWFKLPDAIGDEGFLCVVEQVTPELVFQPPEGGHPNGALGVDGVTIVSGDPATVLEHYGAVPGLKADPPDRLTGGTQGIDVLDPSTFAERFPGTGIPAPALAGFTVGVDRLDQTRACLEVNGVTVHAGEDDTFFVLPKDACGAVVIFQER